MSHYSQKSVAHSDNSKSRGGPADTNRAAGGARRRALLLGTALAGTVALVPYAAQAAPKSWLGGTTTWSTTTNWSPTGAPATTSAITIANSPAGNQPVINSSTATNLSGVGGSLFVGTPAGQANMLTINNTFTLTMGTNTITLGGGTITGLGTVSSSGTIDGFGTFSAKETGGAAWNADSLNGFLNLSGSNTYTGGTFTTSSATGAGFSFNSGVTLSGIATAGTSGVFDLNGATITNLTQGNSGATWNVLADSTLSGGIAAGPSAYTFNLGGANGAHTLNLLGGTTAATFNSASSSTPFSIGAGGTLNSSGASGTTATIASSTGSSISMAGGAITNTGGGTFNENLAISGYGSVSGPGTYSGGVTATGGTMTLNGAQTGTEAFTGTVSAGAGGSLAIGSASPALVTFGTSTTNGTLAVGANNVALNGNMALVSTAHGFVSLAGGTLSGTGSINPSSAVGTISGYGTLSVPSAQVATWNANTAGQALTLTGGGVYTGNFTTASGGIFNWTNATVQDPNPTGTDLSWIATSGGIYNLNGATMVGGTGPFNQAYVKGGNTFNVLGDVTVQGNINFSASSGAMFLGNIGGHTVNLSNAYFGGTSGTTLFNLDAGSVLNDYNGDSTVGSGGAGFTMAGGSITNTSGVAVGTTAGKLTISSAISGYGNISGYVNITGTAQASGAGKTLTIDGGSGSPLQLGNSSGSGAVLTASNGATLDLKGNLSFIEPATSNPGTGGTVQFDGANITNGFSSSPVSINNSGVTTSGLYKVASGTNTLSNVAFSTGTAATLEVDSQLNLDKGAGTVGASVDSRSVTINAGGAVNDYNGPAKMTVGTLNLNGGSLTNTSGTGGTTAGAFTVTVSTDYVNANWGSGNSFNPDANVSGNTVINAAGTGPFQAITGSAVTGGASTTPTLALGALHVGDSTSRSFAIKNTGTSDPSLRGAVQTTGITDSRLGGVTAGNFGPIASGVSTSPYTVTFNATGAGALTGQSIAVVSNFANVPTQTVGLTGAAYHYADPVWSKTGGAGSFTGSGNSYILDFGTLHNGVVSTADLQILNQLFADDPTGAFTDLLDGSFTTNVVSGVAFDLTGFSSFSGVAAGGAVAQTVSYDHHGAPYGLYDEIITFTPTSYDGPLGDSTLAPITLEVHAVVAPEAATITMMLAGFSALFTAGLARRRNTERAIAI